MALSRAEVELLIKARNEASRVLKEIDRDLGAAGKSAGGFGKMLGSIPLPAAAGAAAVAGVGIAAVTMAKDFEKGMAEVRTLIPQVSDQGFGKLQKGVLDFSKEMGIATDQVVPALYQALSSGVPPDNVLDFMKTAAQASIGGVTDLETAVDGITTVVNSYGAEVVNAQKASDVMFTTVKLGKTNFAELSGALFQVLPTASSLGVSFEEVSAALATMTLQGVPTTVATTQLRQAMVEASQGGTELDKAIRNLSGQSFAELIAGGATAQGTFQQLRDSMPEQEFKDLFGSVEAMNAALLITGPNAGTFAKNLDEMKVSGGATDKAFQTMSKTFDFQLNKALNLLKVTMMEVGLEVLPHVTRALEKLNPWLEKNLPIAIEHVKDAWEDLQPHLEAFVDTIQRDVIPVVQDIIGFIREHWPEIRAVIEFELREIQNKVQLALDVVQGIFKIFHGVLTGDWSEAWEGIKQILGGVMSFIQSEIQNRLDLIKALFGTQLAAVRDTVFGIFNEITTKVSDSIEQMKMYVAAGVEAMKTAVNGMASLGSSVANAITGAFKSAWNAVAGIVNAAIPNSIEIPLAPDIDLPDNPLPLLHSGGVVPGPPGAEVLAQLQAGEVVLSRAQVAAATAGFAAAGGGAAGNGYGGLVTPPGMSADEYKAALEAAVAFAEAAADALQEALEAAVKFKEIFSEAPATLSDAIGQAWSDVLSSINQETRESAQRSLQMNMIRLQMYEQEMHVMKEQEARDLRIRDLESEIATIRETSAARVNAMEEQVDKRRAALEDYQQKLADVTQIIAEANRIIGVVPKDPPLIALAKQLAEDPDDARVRARFTREMQKAQKRADKLRADADRTEKDIDSLEAAMKQEAAAAEQRIASLTEQITVLKDLVGPEERRLQQLQFQMDELQLLNEQQGILNDMKALEIQLNNDLLPTQSELEDSIEYQIANARDLQRTYDHLSEGQFRAADAAILLRNNLDELADALLLVISGVLDPSTIADWIGSGAPGTLPGQLPGVSGQGPVTVNIQQWINEGDPVQAMRALALSAPPGAG